MDNQELWALKAAAWEYLAFSLTYPEKEFADIVISGEWEEAAFEIADQLGLQLDERFAQHAKEARQLLSAEDSAEALRALRVDATHLFVGERRAACSPYEGVWCADDKGIPAVLMVNPQSLKVERFMKACGLGLPEGVNVPIDHIVSECELLQYLAMLEAGMTEPLGNVTPEDLPGGSAHAAYVAFLMDHAEGWIPRFALKVYDQARHPALKATALFLKAVMDAEHVQ